MDTVVRFVADPATACAVVVVVLVVVFVLSADKMV